MIQGKKVKRQTAMNTPRQTAMAHTKANRDGLHMRERARERRETRERERNEE